MNGLAITGNSTSISICGNNAKGISQKVILPPKLLCIDLLDPVRNTPELITAVCYNPLNHITTEFPLIKQGAGVISILDNYDGFKRCLKVEGERIMFTADWNDIRHAMGGFSPQTNSFTLVFFSTTLGLGNNRSGLSSVYNLGQIASYQGYNNDVAYFSFSGPAVFGMGYGNINNSEIKFFAQTNDLDKPSGSRVSSNKQATPFFVPLSVEEGFNILITLLGNGTFRFLASQEGYYFVVNSMTAGMAIYDGVLNTEQLEYIYNTKTL